MSSNSEKNEDMYGQIHPEETPELIAAKLQALETELEKLPVDDKDGWMQAQEKCSTLTLEDHKLCFLRCEVFNADLAARRLANYWNKRISIFGPTKAFLPLTLDEALKDDASAISVGFIRLIPAKDPAGRAILFADPSRLDKSRYERESMARALWYVLHAALEDESVQQKGIVFMAYPHHAQLRQFDRPLVKLNIESIKACLPVRVAAFHICHPPTFFAIIFPIMKLFMNERLRKRIKVHTGSEEQVLQKLAKFGLTKDHLPTDLGGNLSVDHDAWLLERKASSL